MLYVITIFSKHAVYEVNVRKYCTARESTDDNMIWNIRILC
jgi:hypothetical protein